MSDVPDLAPRDGRAAAPATTGPGPRYTSLPDGGRVPRGVRRGRLPRAASPRGRTAGRRAAVALRPPAVLRGALHLLRLQRGHHAAPATRSRRTISSYLEREIDLVAARLPRRRRRSSQLHWGGGTPTYLTAPSCEPLHARLSRALHASSPDAELGDRGRPAGHDRRAASTRCAALGFNRALARRAGLHARGPGGDQPRPDVRRRPGRSSTHARGSGFRVDQHRPDLRPAAADRREPSRRTLEHGARRCGPTAWRSTPSPSCRGSARNQKRSDRATLPARDAQARAVLAGPRAVPRRRATGRSAWTTSRCPTTSWRARSARAAAAPQLHGLHRRCRRTTWWRSASRRSATSAALRAEHKKLSHYREALAAGAIADRARLRRGAPTTTCGA